MYIALYKNDPTTVFTQPAATPNLSNYLQIVEGSNRSLWQCTRTGTAAYWAEVPNPGGVVFACSECPPTSPAPPYTQCTCTIAYQRYYRYIPDSYVYSWTKVQDGYPNIIFGGIIKEVKEDIIKRVYDKDTSKFEGLADEILDEPLIFVFKKDDGTVVYSGYVNSWSQDDKVCSFKGLDFKTILDTEIRLDFYADWVGVNLQVSTILEKVFDSFDANQPEVIFDVPTVTTDTTYIANLLGQVFNTNALQFIKVYLVTAGLFLACGFNEITKKIEIDVVSTDQESTIHLDDFVHESSLTDTKTNKCIATIKLPQESKKDFSDTTYLKSSQEYYNSLPADRKTTDDGKDGDETGFIRFSTYQFQNSWPNQNAGRYYYQSEANVQTILGSWAKKFLLHIPYHPNIDFNKSFIRENGSGSAYFNNTREANATTPIISAHTYTEFGQGWFEVELKGTYPVPYAYFEVRLVLKNVANASSELGSAFLTEIANKIIFAPTTSLETVEVYVYGKTTQLQEWYMSPVNPTQEFGETPPYGYAVRTYDGSTYYYWQVGQVPREPKPVPARNYYLGKDNEIYEEFISPANQIFPVQQKIIEEEFFYKAQFNAVYELVNSRFNRNIIVLDNKNVNPLELSSLGLNAKITVYDKMNNVAILPVSEIEIRNGSKRVKLGFKKILLTEVLKG